MRGPSALAALASSWRRLQKEANAGPTIRLEWVQAYVETLGSAAPDSLQVVTVETADGIVALAPMLRKKRHGVPVLESIGVEETNEPADLLYGSSDALRNLVVALCRCRCPLVFPRLSLGGPTLDVLRDTIRYRGVMVTRPGAALPSVVLGSTTDSLLNAGRRSDMRRARRKAQKLGAVSVKILSPEPSELPTLLETALQIEASGWKGRNRSALLNEHPNLAFFRRYFTLAAESRILRLAVLNIAGEPAAMQLAVECGGALWLLKIGYDERFANCTPGGLLMWEVLASAVERGLNRCEFLGNAEPWTKLWTTLECPCASAHAVPIGFASVVYLAARGAKSVLATRQGLPA
jgi:CelD/BcsL family acetyltransferase involved in cellulose biosynthesis